MDRTTWCLIRSTNQLAYLPSVEQIILKHSARGMDTLALHLSEDYCAQAAQAAWASRDHVLITTGFYIASAGSLETDGPPGAFFLARGLASCGTSVGFVAEDETLALLRHLTEDLWPATQTPPQFFRFPIMGPEESQDCASDLCVSWLPTLAVAVERCGRNKEGQYLNRRGMDISEHTARVDELFEVEGMTTIGIGDGGNEVGMGKVYDAIINELGATSACAVATDHLIVSTVSNWGAYGLLACLSAIAGRDLLPTDREAVAAIELLAELGAVNALRQSRGDGRRISAQGGA